MKALTYFSPAPYATHASAWSPRAILNRRLNLFNDSAIEFLIQEGSTNRLEKPEVSEHAISFNEPSAEWIVEGARAARRSELVP